MDDSDTHSSKKSKIEWIFDKDNILRKMVHKLSPDDIKKVKMAKLKKIKQRKKFEI